MQLSELHEGQVDIVIVGAGLVGAALAIALAETSLNVVVIESKPSGDFSVAPKPTDDDRSIALSRTSRTILQSLGVWDAVLTRAQAIQQIHVSDKGRFGFARIYAEEEGLDALGFVAEYRHLYHVLNQRLAACEGIKVIQPATLESAESSGKGVRLLVRDNDGVSKNLSCRLMIVADGSVKRLAKWLDSDVKEQPYFQQAIVTTIRTELPHNARAFERFTSQGPMALLPLPDNKVGVVWTWPEDKVSQIMQLNDLEFGTLLQEAFGRRLGEIISIHGRAAFPLTMASVNANPAKHILGIGNSRHTLHPVAGQGLNLGLRDVAFLIEHIEKTSLRAMGTPDWIRDFDAMRKRDERRTMTVTDALVRVFSNDFLPLAVARNAGLLMMDQVAPVKSIFARVMSGSIGPLPAMARGAKS